MPSIPQYLLQSELPSSSGMPSITPNVPGIHTPDAPLGASQLLGGGIAQVGAGLSQAGQLMGQAADLQARTQHADDVIAAKLKGLQAIPALQTMYDTESQSRDYPTFSKRVLEQGRSLMQDGGKDLNPRAAQLYQASVLDKLNALHQQSLTDTSKRRDEAAAYVFEGEFAQAQKDMLNAQSVYERLVAQDRMELTAEQMVDAGLARGIPARERIRKTLEEVQVQDVQRMNRVDPKAMVPHLEAIAAGKPGKDGLPVPPQQMVAQLLDDAQSELREARETTHRGDVQAERDAQKGQEKVEVDLTNELYGLATAENPDPKAIAVVQRKIMAAGKDTLVSDEGHRRLLSISGTLLRGMEKTKPLQDDPATVYRLERGTTLPDVQYPWPTTAEIDDAVKAGRLKPETGARILKDRVKLLDEAHPSKIAEVQQGKTRVREGILQVIGFVDFSGGTSGRRDLPKGPQLQRYNEADALYDAIIKHAQDQKSTPQDKIEVARKLAEPLKQQILDAYTLYFTPYAQRELPKLMGGLEDVFAKDGITAAVQALEAMKPGLSPAEYQVQARNLKRREELQWTGGTPLPLPVEEPSKGVWDRMTDYLKSWGRDTGTPRIQ